MTALSLRMDLQRKHKKTPTAEIKHAKALKQEFEENENGNH